MTGALQYLQLSPSCISIILSSNEIQNGDILRETTMPPPARCFLHHNVVLHVQGGRYEVAPSQHVTVIRRRVEDWRWMCNRLQLNALKTEFIWCAPARRRHHIPDRDVEVRHDSVHPVQSARDLGVRRMRQQSCFICSSIFIAFYSLFFALRSKFYTVV